MLPILLLVNALFMTAIAATTFVFQSYKWWRPENCDPDRYGTPGRPRGKGLILLAARFEENVIGPTLERLAHLDYPDCTVAVIIDHPDDPGTLAVARAVGPPLPAPHRAHPLPRGHRRPQQAHRAQPRAARPGGHGHLAVGLGGRAGRRGPAPPRRADDGRPPVPGDRRGHRAGGRAADELQLGPAPDATATQRPGAALPQSAPPARTRRDPATRSGCGSAGCAGGSPPTCRRGGGRRTAWSTSSGSRAGSTFRPRCASSRSAATRCSSAASSSTPCAARTRSGEEPSTATSGTSRA